MQICISMFFLLPLLRKQTTWGAFFKAEIIPEKTDAGNAAVGIKIVL